ncbi:MAG: ABC transporter substrate-binding protein [Gammaproteobacteria bacterium]|nr:ABC transporter substrate-binding protein [Gammaproteobacteria bacterium]
MTAITIPFIRRLGLAALLLLGSGPTWASDGPREVIRSTVDAVIEVLADDSLERDQRIDRIRRLMHERFDFLTMSRSVLARNWRDASPAQQERFTELFPELLLHTYMAGLEGYTNEVVEIEDTRMKGQAKASVATKILSGDKAIPVSYRLRENDSEWQIYDVTVEGVSLVNNYRGSFGSIVSNDGMDGLLKTLATKVEELRRPPEG